MRLARRPPNGSTETAANGSGYNFPNSKRIYLGAELHRDVRVPFREISLAPTKSMNGETEANEPRARLRHERRMGGSERDD